ncbi:MAG: cysteine--1-D-myo-inosityl 2-amino-2-deoxy-alpha-D-glucopyranoside ligase, partial [Micrococcales bacterium]|nr:cysteine--1-D-myo-inosityl 2-amino-2-deoxy-alpha-D-glucopyranoside ligase [Micrococcales bacterium]
RATATGVDWRDLAARETARYAQDMAALRVIPPDAYVGAVESVPAVVGAVESMLAAGTAYRVPTPDALTFADGGLGDVYADLRADPAFGEAAGLDRDAMLVLSAERGGDPGRPGKRDPLDPLLWRRERAGEPAWDGGSLGRGRPGWHIECVVIARGALGSPLSVLGGGSDLAFPHHEMSCSHVRVLTGDPAAGARAHVHTGMVGLDGEKMSKSKGNLVLVSTLRGAGVDPMAIRLAILAHRYRDDWEWTDGVLRRAQERLDRWRRAILRGANGAATDEILPDEALPHETLPDDPASTETVAAIRAALADDLDAPAALAAVDAWADATLAAMLADGTAMVCGKDAAAATVTAAAPPPAPSLVARAVDALLGVRL